MKKLSGRLEAVTDMIRPADLLWDIGCDHGFVCIKAVLSGKIKRAVAADKAAGPLAAASSNIAHMGLSGKISCVLSDGFHSMDITETPGCIIITGMGGRLIADILKGAGEKGLELNKVPQLVIGPQSELEYLRHFVTDSLGLLIHEERCIFDEHKYYMLMDVVPGKGLSPKERALSEAGYCFGENINPLCADVYTGYLKIRRMSLSAALHCAASAAVPDTQKINEIRRKLKLLGIREREEQSDEG